MKTKEVEKLMFELNGILGRMRNAGVDFIVCANTGMDGKKHNISTDVNVRDDHHYLDMVASIMETWWKANHK